MEKLSPTQVHIYTHELFHVTEPQQCLVEHEFGAIVAACTAGVLDLQGSFGEGGDQVRGGERSQPGDPLPGRRRRSIAGGEGRYQRPACLSLITGEELSSDHRMNETRSNPRTRLLNVFGSLHR